MVFPGDCYAVGVNKNRSAASPAFGIQRTPVFLDSNRGIGNEYFNRGNGTFNYEPDRQEKGKNNDSKASVSLRLRASQALMLRIAISVGG